MILKKLQQGAIWTREGKCQPCLFIIYKLYRPCLRCGCYSCYILYDVNGCDSECMLQYLLLICLIATSDCVVKVEGESGKEKRERKEEGGRRHVPACWEGQCGVFRL